MTPREKTHIQNTAKPGTGPMDGRFRLISDTDQSFFNAMSVFYVFENAGVLQLWEDLHSQARKILGLIAMELYWAESINTLKVRGGMSL